MAYDVWGVRGLYGSLGGGWTYLNAHVSPQVPEKVAGAVARSFRNAASVPPPEPVLGSHSRSDVGLPEGAEYPKAARVAIADLAGVMPEQVVLGPSVPALYSALVSAMRPMLRHNSSMVLNPVDRPVLSGRLQRAGVATTWAQADLATGDLPAWQYRDIADGSTRLVSVPAAHPELGNVVGVADIVEAVREKSRAWVLVDASAYAPYRPLDLDAWGADIAAVDMAQFGGPEIAALIFRDVAMFKRLDREALELEVSPGLAGGVPATVEHYASLVEGAAGRSSRRNRLKYSMGETTAYLNGLRDDLHTFLGTLPAVHIVGVTGEAAEDARVERIPRLAFGVRGVPSETVLDRLVTHGIVAAQTTQTQLLDDMGVADMGGAVTIAMSPFNTQNDIEQLVRTVASLA